MDKNNKLYYSPAAFDCACAASIRDLGWQIHDKLQLICKIEKNIIMVSCCISCISDYLLVHSYQRPHLHSLFIHEQTTVAIIA